VGAVGDIEKLPRRERFLENPHPGSLSFADPPRKGEGTHIRVVTSSSAAKSARVFATIVHTGRLKGGKD